MSENICHSLRDETTGRFRTIRPKSAKKLLCPHCGKKKYKREFVLFKTGPRKGQYSCWCRQCQYEVKKQKYMETRRPDGVYLCKDGTTREIIHTGKRGGSCKIYWSEDMIDYLKRNYATTNNEDLAFYLRVSQRTMSRKAKELGLKKSPLREHNRIMENCRKMAIMNKYVGNSGQFKKGNHYCPEHEFKPKEKQL